MPSAQRRLLPIRDHITAWLGADPVLEGCGADLPRPKPASSCKPAKPPRQLFKSEIVSRSVLDDDFHSHGVRAETHAACPVACPGLRRLSSLPP